MYFGTANFFSIKTTPLHDMIWFRFTCSSFFLKKKKKSCYLKKKKSVNKCAFIIETSSQALKDMLQILQIIPLSLCVCRAWAMCPEPPPYLPQPCQTLQASTRRAFGASWASSGPYCSLGRLTAIARSSLTSASSVTSERAPTLSGNKESDSGKQPPLFWLLLLLGQRSKRMKDKLICGAWGTDEQFLLLLFILHSRSVLSVLPHLFTSFTYCSVTHLHRFPTWRKKYIF